jgi:hypothetical protein
MATSPRASAADAVRNAVPFLVITVIWIAVMIAVYGLFLVTKPTTVSYDPWVHAFVFAVPAIGYVGQVLQQAVASGA